MADGEWYYQLDDKKVRGPVTMSFLQTAYAQGKLRSRHAIRFRESGDWVAANSFRQMVEARVKYQKLLEKQKSTTQKTGLPDLEGETDDAIEAPTEIKGAVNNELVSDPWYGILTRLFTAANLMPDPFDPDDRVWFMWVGRKLGPFSFCDLVKMGQEGTLKVTDWVSHADSEDWTPLSPESEAAAAEDQSAGDALADSHSEISVSDSNAAFGLSDSHIADALSDSDSSFPGLSDSDASIPGVSDSWVAEGDSGSGMAIEGGSDSGTYGMPPEPEAPRPGETPYRSRSKAAPPKIPDQLPSAVLAEAEPDDEEEDQSDATAIFAAQLLAGTVKPAAINAASGNVGGDELSRSGPVDVGGLPVAEQQPLVERIKEAGPRGWALMAAGAFIVLYMLSVLISMVPASSHARYQFFLDVYAEVQSMKERKSVPSDEWRKYFYATIPKLQQTLMPMIESPPEQGTGDYFLLEGGKQLLIDFENRRVRNTEYTPWFLQNLKKAADELGYTAPEGVPAGEPPKRAVLESSEDDTNYGAMYREKP